MDVSVIVVNYNTAELTKKCIESVLYQEGIESEIIVVDNASVDNSVEVLRQFNDKIKLIANKENVGFGRANNQAFKLASGQYIFLLNPDARLQNPEDLTSIFDFMKKHPEFGLVSTAVVSPDGKKATLPKTFYPGEQHMCSPYRHLPGKIAWVLGASMVFSYDMYEKLGGFDEDYFLYGEDVDISLRVRKLGFQIGYLSEVEIVHEAGASERTSGWYDVATRKQRALILFYQKHYLPFEIKKILRYKCRRAVLRNLFYRPLIKLGYKKYLPKYERNKAVIDNIKASKLLS